MAAWGGMGRHGDENMAWHVEDSIRLCVDQLNTYSSSMEQVDIKKMATWHDEMRIE
jgi:hypothetical protein